MPNRGDGSKPAGIEVTARVITDSQSGDIIDQYIDFTHILDQSVMRNGTSAPAIHKAVQYCIEHGILSDYLQHRGVEEVVSIMMTLFQDEIVRKNHDAAIRREGKQEGITLGGIRMCISMVRNGLISEEAAANQCGLSPEAFRAEMEKLPS